MKQQRVLLILSILLVFCLSFGACGLRPTDGENVPAADIAAEDAAPQDDPDAANLTESSPAPAVKKLPLPGAEVNPLTGEQSKTDLRMVRPLAVMVENNHSYGMISQAGIAQADILIEFQTEQITRNMALYMDVSDVPAIYPVLSARSYFASAAMAFDAIFAHAGKTDDGVENSSAILAHFTDNDDLELLDTPYGYRMEVWPHIGEHGFATNGQLLTDAIRELNTRTKHKTQDFDSGLRFSQDAAPTDGESAQVIRIVFPGNKIMNLSYDAEKNGYTGYQWDTPYVDDNTGEAVVFQNVLVLGAPTKIGADDYYHAEITITDVEGSGYFFNGGYAKKITWSRGGLDTPFRFYDTEGNDLAIGVGHSYIAFVSSTYGGASFS